MKVFPSVLAKQCAKASDARRAKKP